MQRGERKIPTGSRTKIEHDSEFESLDSQPEDDTFVGNDAVSKTSPQDAQTNRSQASGTGEESEDEYIDDKSLVRVDVTDPSMHRVFDKSEEALLIRVMIRTGCRLAYPEFKHTIASVLREKGWKTAERLSLAQLENKVLNKVKVLNKRVKRQDLGEYHYLRDVKWFEDVEQAIMEKVNAHEALPSQARQYSSKSTNLRRSSQRLRYAAAEERMLRHWMVTLDKHAVKQVTGFYEGTRNNDMIKHKLREIRKLYSDKPSDGTGPWSKNFKIDPSGHFDASSQDCWAPGPIPQDDIDAFRVRLHQLKREMGKIPANAPAPSRQSAGFDTIDDDFDLEAFSEMDQHSQPDASNVDALLDSRAESERAHSETGRLETSALDNLAIPTQTSESPAQQFEPGLPRRVSDLIEILKETVQAVKEAGRDKPDSCLPAYAKLLEQARLGSVMINEANKAGTLDDGNLSIVLESLGGADESIKTEQMVDDALRSPEPSTKRVRRV